MNKLIKVSMVPGECISIDQLVSSQFGFIAPLKGRLPCKQYKATIIFVDNFSHHKYMHFDVTLLSNKMAQAMNTFQKFSVIHGV